MSAREDAARRKFLGTLVDALDERWVPGYAVIEPYGVVGLTLRCQGVDGFVQVVPSVLHDNVISWRPFPGTGRPHFDLKPDGTGHLRTCVLADAVAALGRWAASKAPVVRGDAVAMLPEMRARLEAIAAAPPATVEDAIEEQAWALTPAGAAQLAKARAAIAPAAIARAFPRDDDGRLALDERVLLAQVASSKRLGDGRAVFLAARGPRVRKDGARIELVLVDAIAANETHRWMDAPWLWRARAKAPPEDPRAAACVALLDAGRFDDALALFGIALSERAVKVLEGVPLGSQSSHVAEWRQAMRRTLWAMAPWRLVQLRSRERIALLPHQRHQVKTWIAWQPPGTIDLENTGSNARLAQCHWRREVDLAPATAATAQRTPSTRVVSRVAAPATPRAPAPEKALADLIAGKELWSAKTALAHAKRRPVRAALAELQAILASERPPAERANALWIAGEIAEPVDGPTLAAFLADRHDVVRRVAIEVVKRMGYTGAVPALAAIVCGGGVHGVYAATALKTLSGTRGASGLVRYFAHADPRVREAACRAFAIFQDGRKLARPHLEKALLDEDRAVVAAATKTLAVFANHGPGTAERR